MSGNCVCGDPWPCKRDKDLLECDHKRLVMSSDSLAGERGEGTLYSCHACGYIGRKKPMTTLKPSKTPMERCGRIDPWLG